MRRHAKAIVAISALLLTLILGVTLALATAPTVSVDNATAVSYASAHVSGEVDPQGQATTYRFQFTPQAQFEAEGFENSATGPEATIEGPAEPVAGGLENLAPNTTYHLRLVAENADGPSEALASATFTTLEVTAPTASIDAPSQLTGSTAHFSGHVDPNGADPAFNSDWHFECNPECPGLSGGTVSGSAQEVSADATGLKPGTAYEVTLVASNLGGQSSAGPEGFSTSTVAPEIESTTAYPLEDEATLEAFINPGGLATSYFFEYGTTAAYGQSTAARAIPAGGVPVAVKTPIFGLTRNSGYHFRVVASNSLGTVKGSDRSFATQSAEASTGDCLNEAIRAAQGSTYLPNCRAYEQVSPVDKKGSGVKYFGTTNNIYALSSDGNSAIYDSNGPFAGAGESNASTAYQARRSASGWSTTVLSLPPPQNASIFSQGMAVKYATPDLNHVVLQGAASFDPLDADPSPFVEGVFATDAYIRNNGGPPIWVTRGNSDEPETEYVGAPEFNGGLAMSEDGNHVAFETEARLVQPAGAPQTEGPNIFERSEGETHLVGVDNNGELTNPCGANNPSISRDGSTLVFYSPPFPRAGCYTEQPDLYARINNEITVKISRARDGLLEGEGAAVFGGMARDGSAVLFSSPNRLVTDAPSSGEPVSGGGSSIYRWQASTDSLKYLGFSGEVVTASTDLSSFYFLSVEKLTSDAPAAPGFKLYFYSDQGIQYITSFVPGSGSTLGVTQVSPDGKYLGFTSTGDLTGQGTAGYREIYFYDAAQGQLTCASCPLSGNPTGPASMSSVGNDVLHNISDDGRWLYFESPERLSSHDSNSSIDVYQFDSRTHQVSLISSGGGDGPSRLVSTSASGEDVLFGTTAALDPRDRDGGAPDLYDARVGGGFALPNQPAPCAGEACQGSPAASPRSGQAASEGVTGPGNARRHSSRKCRKGKHRSSRPGKSRCAKHKSSARKHAATNRHHG